MLATKITTHVQDALARLMTQYQLIKQQYTLQLYSAPGAPIEVSSFSAFIATNADQIQLLENAFYALNEGRQLFNGTTYPAVGAQLDGIGTIVGVARNGLGDAEYLVFILGTIAENFSDTTIHAVSNVVSLLYQTPSLLLFEFFPAEVAIEIPNTSPLQSSLYSLVNSIIQASLGAGIGLGFTALYNPSNAFQFTKVGGPQVGGGFGKLSASGGGEFAKLIYNNAGV